MGDQLIAETLPDNTHNRQTSMPRVGFKPTSIGRQLATDLWLRLSSHWDWLNATSATINPT